jgi:tetratricopeptide (TPR) repeat protein
VSETAQPANSRQQGARRPNLQEAISLAHAGAYSEARSAIIALLHEHSEEPDVWFWLACVTESPWEALSSLKKVQILAARYPAPIAGGIEWVQGKIDAGQTIAPMSAPFVPAAKTRGEGADAPPAAEFPWRRWALGILSIALVVILAGGANRVLKTDNGEPTPATPRPTAMPTNEPTPESLPAFTETWEQALERGDWGTAIPQLEMLSEANPADATWRDRLVEAHMNYGAELAGNGEWEAALGRFDAALALKPYHSELQRYRRLVANYLTGVAQYEAGDWDRAIQTLHAVLDEYRGNLPGQRFLFGVHYTLGLAQQAAGNLDGAEAEYQLARPLAEDVLAVDERLTEIAQLRIPPTPIPRQKRIEVSIAKQRLYAYEDDELVYDFVSSTGMYSSPTLPGTFEILDKIPMAYGSTWDLDMPYWMGIYWSGNLENGIHALPILANGQLLWEGYLGQPASYGCVILSTEDAETLYNWAEIGTPVIIY